jgi:hypothetical protein
MNGWLDLKHGAEYTSLSVRTLRRYIGDPDHPLPVRLVGGKWLLAQADLDTWVRSFPRAGEDVDRLVDAVFEEWKGGNHAQKR